MTFHYSIFDRTSMATPRPPHPKRLLSRLASFIRSHALVAQGDRVLVAVSGGPDSVCLAHYLSRLAPRMRLRLTIIHLHHGLRGRAADLDAAFTRSLAERLGLPFSLERLPVKRFACGERRSIEDAARVLRYRALERAARRLDCAKVAVGHQADDQAETFLLHLLRGTKARGLASIPPRRPMGPTFGRRDSAVELVRPLLTLTRPEVREYLRAYGLPSRKDRTNDSDRFTRNWIRRKVLPLLESRNPRIREHLVAIAADLRNALSPAS